MTAGIGLKIISIVSPHNMTGFHDCKLMTLGLCRLDLEQRRQRHCMPLYINMLVLTVSDFSLNSLSCNLSRFHNEKGWQMINGQVAGS